MTWYVLRPRAQRDMEEIWDATTARWNADQAGSYIRDIERTLQRLADNPFLGRAIEDVRAGYRQCRTGSHIVFYRVLNDGIEVVRILHGRMDCEQHL